MSGRANLTYCGGPGHAAGRAGPGVTPTAGLRERGPAGTRSLLPVAAPLPSRGLPFSLLFSSDVSLHSGSYIEVRGELVSLFWLTRCFGSNFNRFLYLGNPTPMLSAIRYVIAKLKTQLALHPKASC